MSRKKIFLHIGTHKTATTTIQAGCVENRTMLLARGFLYPQTGMYLFGQHNIAWEMAEGHPQPWNHVSKRVAFRPSSGGIRALVAEIEASPAGNIILSSEDFDGLHADRIANLRQQLVVYDVEVIVYFREQTSLWQSAWAQFIKSGFVTSSFAAWAEDLLASPASVQRYFGRFDLFLKPWAHYFGKENIHIRRYGVDAYGETIFCDFLRTCHVAEEKGFIIPGNQNVSPGYPALELSRHFAQKEIDPGIRSKICGMVQHFFHEHGGVEGKFHLVSESLSKRIFTHFLPYNQTVAKEYLGLEGLFPEPKHERPLTHFSIDELDKAFYMKLEAFVNEGIEKIIKTNVK